MELLMLFVPAMIGGIIQCLTGFGSSIFTMLAYPLLLPMLKATALSSFILLWLNLFIIIQYREWIRPKLIITPMIAYLIANALGIQIARSVNVTQLKAVFGLFLIAMALYFIFVAKKIRIRGSWRSALVCGSLSGLLAGLFGIGGPPIALYLLAVTEDNKKMYIANIMTIFVTGCITSFIIRLSSGIFTPDMFPMVIPGVAGVWVGKQIGTRILDRIDIETVRKLVYLFLIFSGAVTFLTNL